MLNSSSDRDGPATPVLSRLQTAGIVAVVRVPSPDGVVAACRALCRGGVRAVEITLTVPGAFALIAELAAEFGDDLLVGAGTVLEPEAARRSVDAGAQFIVSPVFDAAVVDYCRQTLVLSVPGALTPTEVVTAWQHGSALVKLFPGRVATPEYVRDLLGPLPAVRLFPTGGIDEAGAAAYLAAGAAVVGIGSRLMAPAAVAAGDTDAITAAAGRFAEVAAQARAGR
ncbi:MAG: bifunctional 4-hydroxy-2-oxoglutarate aldolase/2-dehydro-3-deoxy-phosphogluconate aldolase [Actinobacteria bacterium]|nr:bifunctional 4-hydroxy-2-oxoglutarate aldolase/2-dehydro-3-deoxy-phosphogluconate aldolase [Actinomycetota bacterium]